MSGLTPKKQEELKQMMGKYSGKVGLSLLVRENRDRVVVSMEDGLEVLDGLEDIDWVDWSDCIVIGLRMF